MQTGSSTEYNTELQTAQQALDRLLADHAQAKREVTSAKRAVTRAKNSQKNQNRPKSAAALRERAIVEQAEAERQSKENALLAASAALQEGRNRVSGLQAALKDLQGSKDILYGQDGLDKGEAEGKGEGTGVNNHELTAAEVQGEGTAIKCPDATAEDSPGAPPTSQPKSAKAHVETNTETPQALPPTAEKLSPESQGENSSPHPSTTTPVGTNADCPQGLPQGTEESSPQAESVIATAERATAVDGSPTPSEPQRVASNAVDTSTTVENCVSRSDSLSEAPKLTTESTTPGAGALNPPPISSLTSELITGAFLPLALDSQQGVDHTMSDPNTTLILPSQPTNGDSDVQQTPEDLTAVAQGSQLPSNSISNEQADVPSGSHDEEIEIIAVRTSGQGTAAKKAGSSQKRKVKEASSAGEDNSQKRVRQTAEDDEQQDKVDDETNEGKGEDSGLSAKAKGKRAQSAKRQGDQSGTKVKIGPTSKVAGSQDWTPMTPIGGALIPGGIFDCRPCALDPRSLGPYRADMERKLRIWRTNCLNDPSQVAHPPRGTYSYIFLDARLAPEIAFTAREIAEAALLSENGSRKCVSHARGDKETRHWDTSTKFQGVPWPPLPATIKSMIDKHLSSGMTYSEACEAADVLARLAEECDKRVKWDQPLTLTGPPLTAEYSPELDKYERDVMVLDCGCYLVNALMYFALWKLGRIGSISYPGMTRTAEDGFMTARNRDFYLEDLMRFGLLEPDDLYTHVLETDPKDSRRKYFREKSLAERLLNQAMKSLKLVKRMVNAGIEIPERYRGLFGEVTVPEEEEKSLLDEEDHKRLMAYSALLTKRGQL